MLAVFIGLGLVLGVILGLLVAYANRPKEQESNVKGVLGLVTGLLKI